VEDIHTWCGELVVHVRSGKGGKARIVPVLPGREASVLAVTQNRQPEDMVFAKLPDIDLQSYRREYAQALYRAYAPGWPPLPSVNERSLEPKDYNPAAFYLR